MKSYYYEAAGQQAGPVTGDLLRAHGVQGTTLVWNEEMSDWAPAASVAELASVFQPIPPPLPMRPVPPPLPTPVPASATIPTFKSPSPVDFFAASSYSIPQLGVFEDDTAVYALDSGELVASFEENEDLKRVYKDGLRFNENYGFVLRNRAGEKLLTFYKPAKGLMQMLKHELHVLDAQDQLLGICRNRVLGFANPFAKLEKVITVTDSWQQPLLDLDSLAELKFKLTIEFIQQGNVVGSVVGSKGSGGISRALLVYARDRFEVRFAPGVGLGAVLALHLFVRHRWRA
nr:hypothetical protein [Tanacetum cinerariifolium]